MHGANRGYLTVAALAGLPDFRLGDVHVVPARRLMAGPAGDTATEPLVMQLLVTLAEAAGAVVTRDRLVARCWGGVFVAEESVNRAVSELRRALRRVGATDAIETIPRSGYRLRLPVSGLAPARDEEFDAAMERARQALRAELPDARAQGVADCERAVAIRPQSPVAWGMLAMAARNMAEYGAPDSVGQSVSQAERAARAALALDPSEGHALTALATLQPDFGDWLAAEDRLRGVLAAAPDTLPALSHLEMLLQAVGRTADSMVVNARATAIDPLSPHFGFRRAFKQWIMGDLPAADRTIDSVLLLWPRHPAVWNARMFLFAFTGRPAAARGLLADAALRPPGLLPPMGELWAKTLGALEGRASADIAAARDALLAAAARATPTALMAMLALAILEEVDAAFTVADAVLRRRGSLVTGLFGAPEEMVLTPFRWRRTMPLFLPAAAAIRADPRFEELAADIGLVRYWEARGIGPDLCHGMSAAYGTGRAV